MKIEVKDNLSIHDIEMEFEKVFPFLRIRFSESYTNGKPHYGPPGSGTLIGTLRKEGKEPLEILPEMSVSELITAFSEHYMLTLQVLRKSGNVWLKTSLTDSWTLQHQNHIGKIISGQISR